MSETDDRGLTVKSGSRFEVRLVRAAAAAIGLFTFVIYLKAVSFGFVNWDDNLYVSQNALLKEGWAEFIGAAFTGVFVGNWHPLTMISYKLDYMFWGLDPAGYHLTNVVLHAVTTALVFFLGHRIFSLVCAWERDRYKRLAGAVFCAVLFGMHPLHVESVAWVSERKDVLSALFFVASLICYMEYRAGAGDRGRYAAALALFAASLMSKAMAVTLPVVLLILDFYPLKKINGMPDFARELFNKAPFIALSAVVSVITVLTHSTMGLEHVSVEARLSTVVQGYVFYLEKIIYPQHLIPFYHKTEGLGLFDTGTVVAGGVLAFLTVLSFVWIRKRPYFFAAWWAYLLILLPVIGFVQVGRQAAADRYMYIPSIPLFLLAGGAVAVFFGREGARMAKIAAAAGAILIVAALTVKTSAQLDIWRDDVTLWTEELRYGSTVYAKRFALLKRGYYFYGAGRHDDFLADFSAAVELDPVTSAADGTVLFRADAFMALREFARAEDDFKMTVAVLGALRPEPYLKLAELYAVKKMPAKSAYYASLAVRVQRGEVLAQEEIDKAAAPFKFRRAKR